MRATQVTPHSCCSFMPAFCLASFQIVSNWVARTEFTLRPRYARTGVAGQDIRGKELSGSLTLSPAAQYTRGIAHRHVVEHIEHGKGVAAVAARTRQQCQGRKGGTVDVGAL